jgi:hypothetical protein
VPFADSNQVSVADGFDQAYEFSQDARAFVWISSPRMFQELNEKNSIDTQHAHTE